jgi:hypothetical protein
MSQAAHQEPTPQLSAILPDGLHCFPLRQLVRVGGDAERVFACQHLLDGLARPARYRIVRHGDGGQICAAGTLALQEAQGLLRQAYGEFIRFGGITIHSYVDRDTGMRMAPVMFLRVDAPRVHEAALLQVFKQAGFAAPDVDFRKDRVVIRVDVLLVRLPELERAIAALSDGEAHTMSWLIGYRAESGIQMSAREQPAQAPRPSPSGLAIDSKRC